MQRSRCASTLLSEYVGVKSNIQVPMKVTALLQACVARVHGWDPDGYRPTLVCRHSNTFARKRNQTVQCVMNIFACSLDALICTGCTANSIDRAREARRGASRRTWR